jgi:hypothetical protein
MKLFTLITGIMTVISFALSIKEFVPEYAVYVNNVSYILLGLVMGSTISLFDKAKVQIYRLKSSHIFVYSFYAVIGIVTLVLVIMKDGLELEVLGSVGTFIIITLFFLKPLLDEQGVTITERILLSDIHVEKGNFSEAIWHLNLAKEKMESGDSRADSLEIKIGKLKQLQVGIIGV